MIQGRVMLRHHAAFPVLPTACTHVLGFIFVCNVYFFQPHRRRPLPQDFITSVSRSAVELRRLQLDLLLHAHKQDGLRVEERNKYCNAKRKDLLILLFKFPGKLQVDAGLTDETEALKTYR